MITSRKINAGGRQCLYPAFCTQHANLVRLRDSSLPLVSEHSLPPCKWVFQPLSSLFIIFLSAMALATTEETLIVVSESLGTYRGTYQHTFNQDEKMLHCRPLLPCLVMAWTGRPSPSSNLEQSQEMDKPAHSQRLSNNVPHRRHPSCRCGSCRS